MRKKDDPVDIAKNDLQFKIWVIEKISTHDAYFKILIPLIVTLIGLILGLYIR